MLPDTATTRKVFVVWATAVTELINSTTDSFVTTEMSVPNVTEESYTLTRNSTEESFTTDNISTASNDTSILTHQTLLLLANSSLSFNSTDVSVDQKETVFPILPWTASRVGILFGCLIVMFFSIFGNLLVILSIYFEKKLQTPFNYYLVNLAITDMNVGCSAMSFFTVFTMKGYFPFSFTVCCYWMWSDSTMTFESVATLAAISIDRLWSVTWSLHYRNHNSGKKSLIIIICTWIYVSIFSLPAIIRDRIHNIDAPGECQWDGRKNVYFALYTGILLYYIPFTVMLVAYSRIFYVMQRRLRQITHNKTTEQATATAVTDASGDHPAKAVVNTKLNDAELAKARREKRAFYTLGHIVIAFAICWIPFYIFYTVDPFLPDYLPSWYSEWSYWMSYLNSAVNPLVYGIGNDDFRRAFKKILTFKYCRK